MRRHRQEATGRSLRETETLRRSLVGTESSAEKLLPAADISKRSKRCRTVFEWIWRSLAVRSTWRSFAR